VRIRTATVLSEKGGALDTFRKPVDFNLGAALGDWSAIFSLDSY
jgi:NAD dependent epimerase/dehydratase family enzyme